MDVWRILNRFRGLIIRFQWTLALWSSWRNGPKLFQMSIPRPRAAHCTVDVCTLFVVGVVRALLSLLRAFLTTTAALSSVEWRVAAREHAHQYLFTCRNAEMEWWPKHEWLIYSKFSRYFPQWSCFFCIDFLGIRSCRGFAKAALFEVRLGWKLNFFDVVSRQCQVSRGQTDAALAVVVGFFHAFYLIINCHLCHHKSTFGAASWSSIRAWNLKLNKNYRMAEHFLCSLFIT